MTIKIFHNYNRLFSVFLISIVVVFIYLRPLKSAWHPFIAGDGLGYYAYLPAIFIYDDATLKFEWFNKVYQQNYKVSSFENPEDNFLVQFGERKINKYYQGLSFIWLPFFLMGHLAAKLLQYPQDGFSWPYQWSMAMASLFYLLVGLIFLRKLLKQIIHNDGLATWIPIFIFYGTHLFAYSIFSNTLSHVYSFTMAVLFIYFLNKAFNNDDHGQLNAVLALLFYVLSVAIRPLNALLILLLPIFFRRQGMKALFMFRGQLLPVISLFLLIVCLAVYQFTIMYKQTHSFLPYTYANEQFDFVHNRFVEVLVSYRIGLFVYVPLILLSMLGLLKLPNRRWYLLALFFFMMLFFYSAWWYWPINRRALIDYYFIPTILIGFYLNALKKQGTKRVFVGLMLCSTFYYQLKNYQMSNGVLDEFNTYKEIFWRHFFRTEKANMYLINPELIKQKEEHEFSFENETDPNRVTDVKAYNGKKALALSAQHNFIQLTELTYPLLFNKKEKAVIRFSARYFFEDSISKTHVFIQFFDWDHKSILDVPFYLNKEDIFCNKWDLKEFGYEITDTTLINSKTVKSIGISVWNLEAKKRIFVDDLKVEFILIRTE